MPHSAPSMPSRSVSSTATVISVTESTYLFFSKYTFFKLITSLTPGHPAIYDHINFHAPPFAMLPTFSENRRSIGG